MFWIMARAGFNAATPHNFALGSWVQPDGCKANIGHLNGADALGTGTPYALHAWRAIGHHPLPWRQCPSSKTRPDRWDLAHWLADWPVTSYPTAADV